MSQPQQNKKKPQNTQQGQDNGQQYGEGNYTAAREYQRAATKTAQSGPEQAAKEARRAMQNPKEREELEKAEEKARKGQS